MKQGLKDNLARYGWILTNEDFKAPFDFKQEFRYYLKRYLVDILAVFPFLIILIALYFYKKFKPKNDSANKMIFGTHPIISFKLLKGVLKEDYECTVFVFHDWSKGNFHDGVVAEDIMPKWAVGKDPYLFGSYWAFIWALKNFDIFHLYFDGGFLERTIWWKLEPIIYQLFDKKVILYPYGADVWDTFRNTNRLSKLGQMAFMPRYFSLDFKRIQRTYYWSKYVNLIFGYINYIDFLPRIDVLAFHGHVIDNKEKYDYSFPEIKDKVKIIHYANHGIRKGSHFIKQTFDNLRNERDDFEFESYYGLPREIALKKLDDIHIFIEQITDGFLSYSAVEALLKGKIVLTNLSENLIDFYKYLNYNYYENFFDELPIINVNSSNLKDKITELLNNKENLEVFSKKSEKFIRKMLNENEKAYKLLISHLTNKI